MKTLYLIRHAKSSWDHPGLRDIQRPLNERGLRDAPVMARILRARTDSPVLIVSSPAKRALTTALFFAEAFGIPDESVVRNPAIYEASLPELLQVIRALPNAAETILLFGHNPTFTDVANLFSEDFVANIPTCGIIQIESEALGWENFDETNSRLVWKIFPKDAEY